MSGSVSRIIVVDANAPWVRSLFQPLAGRVEVLFLRALPLPAYRQANPRPWRDAFRWRSIAPSLQEQWLPTLGWSKLGAISSALVAQRCRAAARGDRRCAIVYTLPFYAAVAERLRGRWPQVYFAHDPFRFYAGWDAQRVEACEARLFDSCAAAFAISRRLADDFRARTAKPVFYCPNAVASAFIEPAKAGVLTPASPPTGDHPPSSLPGGLAALRGPIVGCVGQMNASYDWDLIRQTAALLPEINFVFIGPLMAESPEVEQQMKSVLGGPNLRWLGPRNHADLPAYLRGFDVCWNPMKVNDHNHRRSQLRLYDYLATDLPVLSTPLAEVEAHGGLIATAATPAESAALLGHMVRGRGEYPLDLEARRRYLAANTWEERAAQFLKQLESVM